MIKSLLSLSVMIFLVCSPLEAASRCFEVNVKTKDRSLKKIYLKKKKNQLKVKFLYAGETIVANPFFCYRQTGHEECLGDDDSGKFILKKGQMKIKFLVIRTSDDSFKKIGPTQIAFPVKAMPCDKIP